MQEQRISLLVVDDHPMILEGMKAMMSQISFVSLVACCTSAFEAMEVLDRQRVDMVITDISMPEVNGVDLCGRIQRDHPSVKVLAMSTFKERSFVGQMLQQGASGYLLKSAGREEIEQAILNVFEGKLYISNEVGWGREAQKQMERLPILSSREKEVLQLIAEGLPNNQIAEKLFLSAHTVDTHRKNLLTKFGVNNTASLIHFASKHNII